MHEPLGRFKREPSRDRRIALVLKDVRQRFPAWPERPVAFDVVEIERPINLTIGKFARLRVVDQDDQQPGFFAENRSNRRLTPAHNLNARVIVDDDAIAIPR